MGTPRNSARGSGRHQLTGTARPRAGADIQRLRRHYGAVREKDRRQAVFLCRFVRYYMYMNTCMMEELL